MKKKTKRFLGILGLGIVALATGIAINLPSPDAIATTSITDTIVVRVVGSEPDVNITSPQEDSTFTEPNQKLIFDYANVNKVIVNLYVTDADDQKREYTIGVFDNLDYQPGEKQLDLNLDIYGYGDYIIEAKGFGEQNAPSDGYTSFKYVPMIANLDPRSDGSYYEQLVYNTSVVCSVKIDIFDKNDTAYSNPLWTKEYTNGEKEIQLPFGIAKEVSENKKYAIRLIPYSCSEPKTMLYKPIYQEVELKNIVIPDTGVFFQGLNISRIDYLITGLLIFVSFSVFAFVFVMKRRKAYRYSYARKSNHIKKVSRTNRKAPAKKAIVKKSAITRVPKKQQSRKK